MWNAGARIAIIFLSAGFATPSLAAAPPQPQLPGPSATLFTNPYYTCAKNLYVSTSGSDLSGDGSSGYPWATLQHANDILSGAKQAGTCVNVVASRTPYSGVTLSSGGSVAASNGYLVWRCSTLLGCTVVANSGANRNGGFVAIGTNVADYVMIDGFEIIGNNSVYGLGVVTSSVYGAQVGVFASHHFWVLNRSIHGHGQAGIAFSSGDYTYAIHDRIFGNAAASSCDNGAQGSGLGNNVALDVHLGDSGYVTTSDDMVNPNPLIGGLTRSDGSWFHNAYMFNEVYNNRLTPCNANGGDTDGNGIILDTFDTRPDGTGNAVPYPDTTLIAFNLVYNNGGTGIHIFDSEYATVANNTSYNNGIDPYKNGGGSAIDTNGSYGNTVISNIAVAFPGKPIGSCVFGALPYSQFNNAILGGVVVSDQLDRFANNVTMLKGGNNSCWGAFGLNAPSGENPMFNGDTFSCSENKCATPPMMVNVGKTSVGDEATPPSGGNFALSPGSPAIGYGLLRPYLLPQSIDAGACPRQFTTCP